MRAIKFRAFKIDTFIFSENFGLSRFFSQLMEFDEIQQYTGLKDKNGKEIYDGDILSDWNEVDGEMTQSKLQVFWNEKAGQWALDISFNQDKTEGTPLWEELANFDYEITGNIHDTKQQKH